MEIYKKVYIQSVDDLPKETGMYECYFKDHTMGRATYDISDQYATTGIIWWINKVDWYLLPIELPSDEEIHNEAIKKSSTIEKSDYILGAKWMRDQITKQ
jgi:hypothetical protein